MPEENKDVGAITDEAAGIETVYNFDAMFAEPIQTQMSMLEKIGVEAADVASSIRVRNKMIADGRLTSPAYIAKDKSGDLMQMKNLVDLMYAFLKTTNRD